MWNCPSAHSWYNCPVQLCASPAVCIYSSRGLDVQLPEAWKGSHPEALRPQPVALLGLGDGKCFWLACNHPTRQIEILSGSDVRSVSSHMWTMQCSHHNHQTVDHSIRSHVMLTVKSTKGKHSHPGALWVLAAPEIQRCKEAVSIDITTSEFHFKARAQSPPFLVGSLPFLISRPQQVPCCGIECHFLVGLSNAGSTTL